MDFRGSARWVPKALCTPGQVPVHPRFPRSVCQLGALCVLAPALAAPLPGCGPARPGLGGKLQACGDLPCSSDMVPACRTDTSPRGRHSPGSDGQTRGMIYNLFQGIIAANGQPRFALPQGGRAKSINGESNVARPAGSVA